MSIVEAVHDEDPRNFVVNPSTQVRLAPKPMENLSAAVRKCGFSSYPSGDVCVPFVQGAGNEENEKRLNSRFQLYNRSLQAHLAPDLKDLFSVSPGYDSVVLERADATSKEHMRLLVKTYLNEIVDKSAYMRAILSERAPSSMCHVAKVVDATNENFMSGYDSILPWQAVAVAHIHDYAQSTTGLSATFLYHGMGSGKSRTIGTLMYKLINPKFPTANTRPFADSKGFCVFLIAPFVPGDTPHKKPKFGPPKPKRRAEAAAEVADNPGDSAYLEKGTKEAPLLKYVTEILAIIERGAPGGKLTDTGEEKGRILNLKDPRDRKTAITRYIAQATTADGTPQAFKADMSNVFPFAVDSTDEDDTTEWCSALLESIGTFKKRLKCTPVVVIIDEAHVFFDSEKRFSQLMAIRDILLDVNAHFVFSSGTFLDTTPVAFLERKGKFFEERPDKCTVTFMEDIPASLRPDVKSVSLGEITGEQYQFFKGAKTRDPSLEGCLEPFYACARDFLDECRTWKHPFTHPKCVFVIPAVHAVMTRDGKVDKISKEPTANSKPLYDCFVEYIKNIDEDDIQQNEWRMCSPQHINPEDQYYRHHVAICSVDEAFKDMAGKKYPSGAQAYGTGDSAHEDQLPDRVRKLGLSQRKPFPQALVVSKRKTGLDLVGTTHVYFVGRPTDATEYRQMKYRGVRICSLSGRSAEESAVTVKCYGFDPKDFETSHGIHQDTFLEDAVDYQDKKSLYASESVIGKDTAGLEMITRHNFIGGADVEKTSIPVVDLNSAADIDEFLYNCDSEHASYINLIKSVVENADFKVRLEMLLKVLDGGKPHVKDGSNIQPVKAFVKDLECAREYLDTFASGLRVNRIGKYVLFRKTFLEADGHPITSPLFDENGAPDNPTDYIYLKSDTIIRSAVDRPVLFRNDPRVVGLCKKWDFKWESFDDAFNFSGGSHAVLLKSCMELTESAAIFSALQFAAMNYQARNPDSQFWETHVDSIESYKEYDLGMKTTFHDSTFEHHMLFATVKPLHPIFIKTMRNFMCKFLGLRYTGDVHWPYETFHAAHDAIESIRQELGSRGPNSLLSRTIRSTYVVPANGDFELCEYTDNYEKFVSNAIRNYESGAVVFTTDRQRAVHEWEKALQTSSGKYIAYSEPSAFLDENIDARTIAALGNLPEPGAPWKPRVKVFRKKELKNVDFNPIAKRYVEKLTEQFLLVPNEKESVEGKNEIHEEFAEMQYNHLTQHIARKIESEEKYTRFRHDDEIVKHVTLDTISVRNNVLDTKERSDAVTNDSFPSFNLFVQHWLRCNKPLCFE